LGENLKREVSLGLDPGWKNFGAACIEHCGGFKVNVVSTGTFDVSQEASENFVRALTLELIPEDSKFKDVTIERYVAYANVRSGEAENITMLIGMLRYEYHLLGLNGHGKINVNLIRAIEWKTKLVQILSKFTNFDNPSLDLDKKFSLAAAKHISINKEVITNDHIADAVCLASLPGLEREVARLKTGSNNQTRNDKELQL
jgi:hypothetical protein